MFRKVRLPAGVAAEVKKSTWPEYSVINLNVWTEEEHKQLIAMTTQSGTKDFDSIAVAMNTSRTPYECYLYLKIVTFLCGYMDRDWSHQETKTLKSLVNSFADNQRIPWGRVAASMKNRSKCECYAKYCFINKAKRMGNYLWEEDAVILSFVKNFGYRFKDLANILKGRSPFDLEARFKKIRKLQARGNWSLYEDYMLNVIMQSWLVPQGKKFSDFAHLAARTHIALFNNKTVAEVKKRFRDLKAWKLKHRSPDMINALHRSTWARIKPNPEFTEDLALALKCLKDKLVIELESYQEADAANEHINFLVGCCDDYPDHILMPNLD